LYARSAMPCPRPRRTPAPLPELFGPKAQRSSGLHERDEPELDAEADAVLATVGLGGFSDAFPHELSGGMQHRAAFARAIVTHDIEEAVLLGDRVAVMGGRPPGIREVIDIRLGVPGTPRTPTPRRSLPPSAGSARH
jgi:ABC-type nitrate/sulfonate/bicarbonate transport system ATPase subunit